MAREPGAQLVLVARREDRLQTLAAQLGGDVLVLAEDLTDDGAGARIAHAVRARHGRLDLLVNNAGAGWRGTFADGGTANLRQTVELNLFAQAALTEALLPLLRESAPSAIVNVASTSGRVARAGAGAYSASKFGLIGSRDALHRTCSQTASTSGSSTRALWRPRAPQGRARRQGRDGLDGLDAGEGGGSDRRRRSRREGRALCADGPYGLAAVARILLPRVTRKVMGGGGATALATTTIVDTTDRPPPAPEAPLAREPNGACRIGTSNSSGHDRKLRCSTP